MATAQNDPAYTSALTELHPHHSTSLFQPPSSSSAHPRTSDPPLLESTLSVLTSGEQSEVGGARDPTGSMSLSHVLSGLQEEGALAEVLQDQPNLTHALSEVSSDPESLRFQYQPGNDPLLQQLHMPSAGSAAAPSKRKTKDVYREQDRFLPLHNVARTMRNALPANGKVSKDAKECMQECVSEFISFITSEASDKCIAERRKTITGDDILFAMATLGFDNYIDPLRLYLQKWREFSRRENPGQASNLPIPANSNSLALSHGQAPVGMAHPSPTVQQNYSGLSLPTD